MQQRWIRWTLPCLLAAAGVALFSVWIYRYVTFTVPLRLAGADHRPSASAASVGGPENGTLENFDGKPSEITESWPFFRGPNYDGIYTGKTPLLSEFPAAGPAKLWQLQLGEGYAGAAVADGRVYIIDYDMKKQADAIRCFGLDDGKEIWRYSYPLKIKRNHGMSRTVPAVADGIVVTIGPKCHVTCLKADTGEYLWSMDLVRDYDTKEPLWYAGQCPRIDNGRVIISPGGKALMVAVDALTGKVIWQTDNPDKWQMTHSSILSTQFGGKKMYVYCASGGVAGIEQETGKVLWKTDQWKMTTNVPTPVDVGDGKLFFSAGYNKGSMMLQLEQQGEAIVPKVLFTHKASVFGADQQTPIYYKGYIYGVRPDKQLVCMDLGGKIIWTSGSANKYGLGPYIIADEKIVILDDDGLLSIIEARPDQFSLLTQAKVLEGHECWGPMALVQGRLIVRDLTTMVCVDIAAP